MGTGDADTNGYWNLYDPYEVMGYLNSTEYTSQSFPITGMEWTYDNYMRTSVASDTVRGDDSVSSYDPVVIVCQETATPTRTPSGVPSVVPTVAPSYEPSTSPTTDEPSTAPTVFPSDSPITARPTVSPSDNPTVNPTVDPTQSPTIDTPTTSPSKCNI